MANFKRILPVKPYFPEEDIEEIASNIREILKSGMLSLATGKYVLKFEEEYARLCQTKYAVAVNSGTAALEIAMRCLGMRRSDEVIVPTNTFSASAASVIHAGGKLVLTDIDPETLCIGASDVLENITSKTSAVMVVHIGGIVCPDIKEIKKVCEEHNLVLLEDCAHAHGSTFEGHFVGSFGVAGCFSFYPTKIMTTGEGGMITTNIKQLADTAKRLRDQGREHYGSVKITELGHNWRMNEIAACIGLVQLRRLEGIISKRSAIAAFYDSELAEINRISPLRIPGGVFSNYYKYVTFLDEGINRDRVKRKLQEKGVTCGGEVYDPPLHLQPIYKRLLGTKEGDFPAAEEMAKKMLCLPIHPSMSKKQMKYVVEALEEILG